MIQTYVIYFFSVIVILAALGTILFKNPVFSAASLIVAMLSLAVHFLMLNAEFIAAIQVIVYTGAIMGLFVFVIMILNLSRAELATKAKWNAGRIWGVVLGLVLLLQLFTATLTVSKSVAETDKFLDQFKNLDSTRIIGKVLFSDFLLPFELVSVVLIVGVIGAVVLAKKDA